MIALSKKLFYAVEAVLYVAYNAGGSPISGRDIAECQGLPPRYLEQLLQKLVRGNILRGVRGPHGGYVLAREKRRISVGDICEVLADANDDEAYESTPLGNEIVLPVWSSAQQHLLTHLKERNLAELCEEAQAKNIGKASKEDMNFAI